jgi:glycosyltransferase involved in cell wall biosynthesis
MATYNRSNILGYSIESVLAQSLADIELIVVGDACTDDTPDVVASFRDDRLRFVNLERNFGEQSGPNNVGVSMARGQWLAFCNHDDLWFADHLESALAHLHASSLDLVTAMFARLRPNGDNELGWVMPMGRYVPYTPLPASTWVMHRELTARVGPWRFYRECRDVPSQDWLSRAWKAGARIEQGRRLSVLVLQSDARPGCYARRDFEEHRRVWEAMRDDPHCRESLSMELARRHALYDRRGGANLEVWPFLRHGLRNALARTLMAVGLNPGVVKSVAAGTRRGGFIDRLREERGLPALDSPEQWVDGTKGSEAKDR